MYLRLAILKQQILYYKQITFASIKALEWHIDFVPIFSLKLLS